LLFFVPSLLVDVDDDDEDEDEFEDVDVELLMSIMRLSSSISSSLIFLFVLSWGNLSSDDEVLFSVRGDVCLLASHPGRL
jgi:hypothetical protein